MFMFRSEGDKAVTYWKRLRHLISHIISILCTDFSHAMNKVDFVVLPSALFTVICWSQGTLSVPSNNREQDAIEFSEDIVMPGGLTPRCGDLAACTRKRHCRLPDHEI